VSCKLYSTLSITDISCQNKNKKPNDQFIVITCDLFLVDQDKHLLRYFIRQDPEAMVVMILFRGTFLD
jgi:hypothetical protein